MDGKENPVGRGTGQRVGSQNRGPGRIGESTRLGNFGQPPGHSTMGYDGPDAIEGAAEVPAPSKHMDGKSHPVHRRGKASRPRMNIGDAHHNTGKVKIAAHPRKIKTGNARDLAGYL